VLHQRLVDGLVELSGIEFEEVLRLPSCL